MTPPESMAKLQKSLPKSTLRILPGGHALHVEQVPAIARSLEEFFADTEEV